MKAHCIYHPTKEAKCFCEQCGFMCDPDEEGHEDHTTVNINKKISTLIDRHMLANATKHKSAIHQSILDAVMQQGESILIQDKKELKQLSLQISTIESDCRGEDAIVIKSLMVKDISYLELDADTIFLKAVEKLKEIAQKELEKLKYRMKEYTNESDPLAQQNVIPNSPSKNEAKYEIPETKVDQEVTKIKEESNVSTQNEQITDNEKSNPRKEEDKQIVQPMQSKEAQIIIPIQNSPAKQVIDKENSYTKNELIEEQKVANEVNHMSNICELPEIKFKEICLKYHSTFESITKILIARGKPNQTKYCYKEKLKYCDEVITMANQLLKGNQVLEGKALKRFKYRRRQNR